MSNEGTDIEGRSKKTMTAVHTEQIVRMEAKFEKMKWILGFCAAGGLGIVVTLFFVWNSVKRDNSTQQFIQTKLIDTLEHSSQTSGRAADALKDTANALQHQVDNQQNIDDSIKKMTKAQEELTEEFRNFIQEQKKAREDAKAN